VTFAINQCPLYTQSGHVRCKEGCPLCANSGHATPLSEIGSRGGVSEIPISDFEYQAAAAFRFLRHHARKPPPTNIKPGTPVADNGTGNANGRDGGNIIECKSLAAAQWRKTALTQVPNSKKPLIPLRVISSEKHLFEVQRKGQHHANDYESRAGAWLCRRDGC